MKKDAAVRKMELLLDRGEQTDLTRVIRGTQTIVNLEATYRISGVDTYLTP